MKYRSRTDIVKLILEAANGGGANKSKLMYKAFLSFAQLKEYVTLLLENGLIEYEEDKHSYRTTGKGIHLLQIYNRMEELLSNIHLNEIRESPSIFVRTNSIIR
jgi:predicted transcriptional regulator